MTKKSPKPPDSEGKRRRLEKLLSGMQGQVVRGSSLTGGARKPEIPSRVSPKPHRSPLDSDFLEDLDSPGKDSREDRILGAAGNLRDFYPEAEVLGEEEGRAWKLRVETALDGAPNSGTGVRMPGQRETFEFLDLGLAGVLNPGLDLEDLGREDLAFLDTETTGLMGGTGTYAFLVGLGYFSGETFVVEQYFMEDFSDEEVMLEALGARLGDFAALVTFNGKAFDAPLLRSRFIMNHLPSALEKPHLDLLHPARRIWRGRFESCGLGTIEERVFGLDRQSDVPGSLIPRIYLEYIRGIRRSRMAPVIDHNVQDIVSMAALFALFCRYYREPDSRDLQHGVTQAGLAEWFQRAGRSREALERLEKAVLLCRDPLEEHALSMRVAVLYRRGAQWEAAVDIWRERSRVGSSAALRAAARVELAKYCEHRAKDLAKALEWTTDALTDLRGKALGEDFFEGGKEADSAIPEESAQGEDFLDYGDDMDPERLQIAALLHRLKRIRGKIERKKTSPRTK